MRRISIISGMSPSPAHTCGRAMRRFGDVLRRLFVVQRDLPRSAFGRPPPLRSVLSYRHRCEVPTSVTFMTCSHGTRGPRVSAAACPRDIRTKVATWRSRRVARSSNAHGHRGAEGLLGAAQSAVKVRVASHGAVPAWVLPAQLERIVPCGRELLENRWSLRRPSTNTARGSHRRRNRDGRSRRFVPWTVRSRARAGKEALGARDGHVEQARSSECLQSGGHAARPATRATRRDGRLQA